MIFLLTIIIGSILGFLFDITRIIRKVIKHKNWVVYIEDILLWISTLIIVLYFIFNFSEGSIRFFYFWGFTIGATIYFALFSKYIVNFTVFIINKVKNFLFLIFSKLPNITNIIRRN